jgi:hypothetical protein
MKEVILKIKRKRYVKSEPTVRDVVSWCNHIKLLEEGKIETNKDAIYLMATIVSDYLNIGISKILSSKIKSSDISKAYRKIQTIINNSLIESGYAISKNTDIKLFEEIYKGIMHIANDLFEKGVLPDDFFNQSLRNFILVVTLENDDSDDIMDASQVDETNF